MNREDVVRIALEVGFYDGEVDKCQLMLERFAYLVAQQEREACANLCWKNQDDNAFVNAYNGKRLDLLCSELIRTRGKND
jgi:hypothetical protein